jgi:hypothetical protein
MKISASVRRALLRGVVQGPVQLLALERKFEEASVHRHHGWVLTGPRTALAGSDWSLRAIVAKLELWANTTREAIYAIASDDKTGRALTGAHRYSITFPARLPANAFWSVTMYDGGEHLYANPLHRYALGDRSPGLARDRNGAITILLAHRRPTRNRSSWLPAPAGHFTVVLRLYEPRALARSSGFSPPGVTCLDCTRARSR